MHVCPNAGQTSRMEHIRGTCSIQSFLRYGAYYASMPTHSIICSQNAKYNHSFCTQKSRFTTFRSYYGIVWVRTTLPILLSHLFACRPRPPTTTLGPCSSSPSAACCSPPPLTHKKPSTPPPSRGRPHPSLPPTNDLCAGPSRRYCVQRGPLVTFAAPDDNT